MTTADKNRPPFRIDHVGSFLRPERLLVAAREAKAGTLEPAAYRAVQDECISDIVAFQEEIGLQAVTDGELRRRSWSAGFIDAVDGFGLREGTLGFRDESGDLGLVSTKTPELESEEDIKRRIDEAANFIPLDRLGISPQCGFSSGGGRGQPITQDNTRSKIELLQRVARGVWG